MILYSLVALQLLFFCVYDVSNRLKLKSIKISYYIIQIENSIFVYKYWVENPKSSLANVFYIDISLYHNPYTEKFYLDLSKYESTSLFTLSLYLNSIYLL